MGASLQRCSSPPHSIGASTSIPVRSCHTEPRQFLREAFSSMYCKRNNPIKTPLPHDSESGANERRRGILIAVQEPFHQASDVGMNGNDNEDEVALRS